MGVVLELIYMNEKITTMWAADRRNVIVSLAGSFETFCKILSAVIICHNSELGNHDFIQNAS